MTVRRKVIQKTIYLCVYVIRFEPCYRAAHQRRGNFVRVQCFRVFFVSAVVAVFNVALVTRRNWLPSTTVKLGNDWAWTGI